MNPQQGILPGGCYPPWPPRPFPPEEQSEYGVEDLPSDHDWMTYPHEDLHTMATQGLDLAGANAVAAKWADIGEQLQEVAADLEKAIAKSQGGWEGDAAELARATAARLTQWAEDTSHRADKAGGCVSRQAEIAQRAKDAMPEPMLLEEPPLLCGTPDVNQPKGPLGGTSAMSASSPFTGGGFASAAQLGQLPFDGQERARAAHRQAAEVMQKMQQESYEVYGTVPWFEPPQPRDQFRSKPPTDEPERRRRVDEGDGTTSAASSPGLGSGGPGAAGGGGSLGAPDAGGRTAAGPLPGAGGQSGVGAPGGGAAPGAAAAAAGGARGGMGGMMPMGGMAGGAGGGRGDEQDRKPPSYLAGDQSVFEPDDDVHQMLLGHLAQDDEPPRRGR